jgi:hypothetical protein
MARGKPGIISVGNRHEWPREFWGSEDWEAEDRLQAALGIEPGMPVVVPPPGPKSAVTTLFPKPPRRREVGSARSRAVDKLLDRLGIR